MSGQIPPVPMPSGEIVQPYNPLNAANSEPNPNSQPTVQSQHLLFNHPNPPNYWFPPPGIPQAALFAAYLQAAQAAAYTTPPFMNLTQTVPTSSPFLNFTQTVPQPVSQPVPTSSPFFNLTQTEPHPPPVSSRTVPVPFINLTQTTPQTLSSVPSTQTVQSPQDFDIGTFDSGFDFASSCSNLDSNLD
ncbi:uncharacterized protein MELLADRAFT_61200 [Melampsora larici-populina 98AG31]|uniref:Uncharacterized protein n=1 Tax=Melampsora larici-populina (strain 98AG31 / pathotype 3-4-7) TaxID=747676 RepID=F4RDZ5_MELLP|nr:uncharacterized protein MELLADRAFT_61200 [Melampsora larici-populina 98AG31]EGG09492.1 hypothetical protein MELLADRAFT_61200 [Melampsora larici-populina 98AG31]